MAGLIYSITVLNSKNSKQNWVKGQLFKKKRKKTGYRVRLDVIR